MPGALHTLVSCRFLPWWWLARQVDPSASHCLPICVALQETAGLAAAATTCGPYEAEDAIFVWRLHTLHVLPPPAAPTTSSSAPSLQPGSSSGLGAAAAAGEAAGGGGEAAGGVVLRDQWMLEDVVVLQDTASCLAWVPSPSSLAALLAVGYASGADPPDALSLGQGAV